jgi:hypothetical protein
MNYHDHCIGVGRLWGNLQSLEVTLRLFLTQTNPSVNYITNLDTFGALVKKYNGQLSNDEQSLYSVDTSIVDIRNAIAHGLVSRQYPEPFPLTLLHAASSLNVEMTVEWFRDQLSLTQKQIDRILACGKNRWPSLWCRMAQWGTRGPNLADASQPDDLRKLCGNSMIWLIELLPSSPCIALALSSVTRSSRHRQITIGSELVVIE